MRASFLLALLLGAIELAVSCSPPDYIFPTGPAPRCDDGVENGEETDQDCGGLECEKCANGKRCGADSDCVLGSCFETRCQAQHCTDDSLGHGETDVDCGGDDCEKCGVNQRCSKATDCKSNRCVCQGEGCPLDGEEPAAVIQRTCVATSCDDGEFNGTETDRDCGGGTCPGCAISRLCSDGTDCASGICIEGRCSITQCGDREKASDEEGVDCGGVCPKLCDEKAACSDRSRGGVETDKDCGGGTCPPCKLGQACGVDRDCETDECVQGVCVADPCAEPSACMGPDAGAGGAGSGGGPDTSEGGDGSGGTSGLGGTSAMGGTPGGAGVGGTPQGGTTGGAAPGGSGGTAGDPSMGGTGGSAGMGGAPLSVCPGCARLTVPLANSTHKANFVVKLDGPTSFAAAKIRFRVYKRAGDGGAVKGYVQHGPDNSDGQAFRQFFQVDPVLLSAVIGWTEFTWDVGAQSGDFNKNTVARVGIQVTGAEATSWANPTVIYLDSITITGANVSGWTFDHSGTVFPNATTDANANVIWLNSGDNPVANSSISWFGP